MDAEVFPGGKGQSQEVVALSGFLGIKLHQLPELLHDLIRQTIRCTILTLITSKAASSYCYECSSYVWFDRMNC